MAKIGAKFPCFKPDEADEGVIIGKLVSANLTINLASGEMYADDMLAEQLSVFANGSIAMETDDMIEEAIGVVYGCDVEDKEVTYNIGDVAPRGGLAYYKTLLRNGKPYYQAYFYPRVRAALGNDNAQTKGSSITFQSTSTTFTVFADDEGVWRVTEVFDTEAEAIDWCKEKTDIASSLKNADKPAAGKLAADKALIEAGTFEIPLTDQTDQPTKTAWVQNSVNALIENGTTAIVSFDTTYDIALTNGTATGTANITVTEAS